MSVEVQKRRSEWVLLVDVAAATLPNSGGGAAGVVLLPKRFDPGGFAGVPKRLGAEAALPRVEVEGPPKLNAGFFPPVPASAPLASRFVLPPPPKPPNAGAGTDA